MKGMPSKEEIQRISDLTGKFVSAHAEFVSNWIENNIEQGDRNAVTAIIGGLGTSCSLFCCEVAPTLGHNVYNFQTAIIERMKMETKQTMKLKLIKQKGIIK